MTKKLTMVMVFLCALSGAWVIAQQRNQSDDSAATEQSAAAGAQPGAATEQPGAAAEQSGAAAAPAEEKPFWDAAQAFVDAYAKRDAEAIGQLFTADAEFYDEFGEITVGRDEIAASFHRVFEATPGALIDEIAIDRVRMVSDNVALEEGRVATVEFPGGPRDLSRYIALHVKEKDGQWRIHTLKDYTRNKATAAENLEALSWLVGEWVSEDSATRAEITGRWSDDGNYLIREFRVKFQGRPLRTGVQRIGWDPVKREIRSWMFDAQGGFVEGSWKRNGDQWLVTSQGYNADAETAAGVAVYTVHDAERITWQYRSLVIGNEFQDEVEPVVLVRRPPPAAAE